MDNQKFDLNRKRKGAYIFRPTLFFIFYLLFFFALTANAEMLSVKGDRVNLRTGPGKNYEIKWEYGSCFPLETLERQGGWVKTTDFENDTGWIHQSLLSKKTCAIVRVNRHNGQKINIRKGPSSNSDIVGKAYYGVVFTVLGHDTGWVNVEHESGLTGWISSNLLWGH